MPTYTYECGSCHERQEHFLSIKDHPQEMPCGCGGTAVRVFDWEGQTIVRGAERPWKLDASSVPIGWLDGNTAQEQEARYTRHVESLRRRAQAVDKQAIRGGVRHIASVPREVHRERSKQYGKDYLDPTKQTGKELKEKLKSDGLYLHKD